jgi:hypothetical protein
LSHNQEKLCFDDSSLIIIALSILLHAKHNITIGSILYQPIGLMNFVTMRDVNVQNWRTQTSGSIVLVTINHALIPGNFDGLGYADEITQC